MGPLVPRQPSATADINGQRSAAVALFVACTTTDGKTAKIVAWGASGVAMGDRYVLTAAHAVPSACARPVVEAVFSNGAKFAMQVDAYISGDDVARLVTTSARFPRHFVVRVGKARVGDSVCIVAGEPVRIVSCGSITKTGLALPGDIEHTAITVKGNSGSGLYNSRGELVGIVTHERHDFFQRPTGGRATSVAADSRRWLAAEGGP